MRTEIQNSQHTKKQEEKTKKQNTKKESLKDLVHSKLDIRAIWHIAKVSMTADMIWY